MTERLKHHGWFSKKAAAAFGYTVYLTESGKQVKVTNITDDKAGKLCQWPDREYVGIVTQVVEVSNEPPELSTELMTPEEIQAAFIHIYLVLYNAATIFTEHENVMKTIHVAISLHNQAMQSIVDQNERFLAIIGMLEERIKKLEASKSTHTEPSEN